MARIYLQLQVDFADDEKVARLARYGRDARALRDLLTQMWCYCKREQSDGHVPAEIVGKLVYPDTPKNGLRDAGRLVECDIAERTPTGYYLPGYLKHNKSRAEIAEISARKAEAGHKGGLASGQVRSGQANAKHGGSPPRSHSSENRVQTAEITSSSSVGGERTETLRAVRATEPPTCLSHPDGNFDGPCAGCKRVREYGDKNAEQARRDALSAAANCPRCNGTNWLEDEQGNPTKKCDHQRKAAS